MFCVRNRGGEKKHFYTKMVSTWKGKRNISASQRDQMFTNILLSQDHKHLCKHSLSSFRSDHRKEVLEMGFGSWLKKSGCTRPSCHEVLSFSHLLPFGLSRPSYSSLERTSNVHVVQGWPTLDWVGRSRQQPVSNNTWRFDCKSDSQLPSTSQTGFLCDWS